MDPRNLADKFSGLNIEGLEVLDIGCAREDGLISQHMRELPFKKLVAIDVHAPFIHDLIMARVAAKEMNAFVADVRTYLPTLKNESVDVVVILDMLEHITKQEGYELLIHAKRIARKRVIIWLPLGEAPQEGTPDNPYLRHMATWYKEDLERRGFTVTVFKAYISDTIDAGWAIWSVKE